MEINRIEVIDHTKSVENGGGRVYVLRGDDISITTSVQDDGRTLKVFINKV